VNALFSGHASRIKIVTARSFMASAKITILRDEPEGAFEGAADDGRRRSIFYVGLFDIVSEIRGP